MLVAALTSVWAVERQERDVAAAALLVLWLAAVLLVLILWRAQDGAQPAHARRNRRLTARARACALLRDHLDDGQREEFDRAKTFTVVAQSGRRYRIKAAETFNVRDEAEHADYCMQFRSDPQCHSIPLEDLMLAQKVLLECDEPHFLRVANRRRVIDRLD